MHTFKNNLRSKRPAERGTVLMIALLLVLLGTFGITAWFGLIAARSLEVGAKEAAMIRRVQLNGVKEITRQVGSQSFLAMDGGKTGNTDIQLPGTYGKVTVPPWTGTPYTNTALVRYDQIGGIPAQTYSIDITASLDDGQGALGALDYNLQLRSYVPALRGDLLTIHEPAVATTPVITDSSLLVNGRTVVWDGGNALAHRTERLHTSAKASTVSLVNLAGTALMPDNEIFAPRSTGSDFIGRLKAVNSSESSANQYMSRLTALGYTAVDGAIASGDLAALGYDSDGLGLVSIDLDHPALPHLHIIGNLLNLNVFGQATAAEFTAAEALASRLLVVTEPVGSAFAGLNVTLSGENGRPIVLAIRQDDVATAVQLTYEVGTVSFPRWHSIIDLENSPLSILPSGGGVSELHILGGIRTDASINTTLLTTRIIQTAFDPGLEAIASRAGFVEVYRN